MYQNNNDSNSVIKSYEKYDLELRTKRLKIGLLLGIIFITLFGLLDIAVYPQIAFKMVMVRCTTAAALLLMFFALRKELIRNIKYLGFFWAILLFLSINVLILLSEGIASPYYAGLNLTVVALTVLLPWTFFETLFVCATMLFLYVCSSILHLYLNSISAETPLLINNLFFLVATSIICVTASYFNSELRFKEFCLNYELEEKNEKLRTMDQIKTQFFANISHEFRTPLTLILGPIQDLLHDPRNKFPNRVNNILNTIQQNGLRLLKLVNDLLDLIRLQEGKTNLSPRKLEINRCIAALADSMIHLADIQKVTIKKELPKNENYYIYADEDAMDKIILNLLNNAIKFTKEEGLITISTKCENKNVIIIVEDTGIGIKERDLPHIFERFQQVDNSATRQYQGTGLGLALVKELTELQGGKVTVESVFGEGTKFYLTFPIFNEIKNAKSKIKELLEAEARNNNDEEKEINLVKIHKNAQRSGGLRSPLKETYENNENQIIANLHTILVVDDEPDMRKYIVDLVEEEAKYNVLQAFDGKMGLEMVEKYRPDLVILDLMLPKIDGLEVCRKIRENEELVITKIILLTARIDEDSKISALKNGADDFITKPFSATEVKTRIENLLENRKLQKILHNKNEDLKQTLRELKSTQSQLIQSEKINALGSLSAGLLHEINNPLNYTLTALQLIKADPNVKKDEDLKEIVGDIEEGMGRVKTIVSDLRAFAYPEESTKQSSFSVFDAVTSALRFTAYEAKDVEIIVDVDKNLSALGSNSHIVQILVNLITNACKAIKKSQKEKGVVKVNAAEKNSRIVISVEDNGTGMDEKTLKRVFDPFFTTNVVGEGMGLGLSICHTIIKNHGGSLSAESELGKGSKFFFDLAI